MEISAQEQLQHYDLSSLQQMARIQGIDVGKGSKGVYVPTLAALLFDVGRISRMLADLSDTERTLLERVILAGGEAPTLLIRNQLEGDGTTERTPATGRYGYSSYRREQGSSRGRGSRRFEDLVARLGGLGLLFTLDPVNSSGHIVSLSLPGNRLVIPDGILQHLPSVTLPVETAAAPENIRLADASSMLRDLYLLFSLVDREKIALTNRQLMMKRSLTRVGQVLGREEEFAAVKGEHQLAGFSLLRALAEELGLLSGNVGELLLDPRGEQFLTLPSADRRQRLFDAYRTTARWSELHRVPDVSVRGKGFSVYSAPENVPPARRRVLAELAELPVGEWVSIAHLVNRIRIRAYEYLFSRTPSEHSYQFHSRRYYGFGYFNPYESTINGLGITLDIEHERLGWNMAEAEVIRIILTEALHALGVVDLGGSGETTTVFRITDDGGRLLRGEPLAIDIPASQVVVQPNFQVFAFSPTGEDILFMLERVSERRRTGQAMEYELTRDSLYRAQQSGLDTAAVIAFLEQVSTHELPQNVRRSLEEWGAQHERVTLRRRASFLQTLDETTLDALFADEAVRPLLGRRLTPTAALVASGQVRQLHDRLIEQGRLPALSEGPGFHAGPQLRVEDDGAIAFRHPVPSIFALHDLRSFADFDERRPRITQDSLRRAALNGLIDDDVLAILERLSGDDLTEASEAFVRRWAKDWGQASLYDATILQVDTAQQLTSLLADPEISPLLQPIPDAPTLAIVTKGSRKRLQELLKSFGMALR